MTVHMNLYFTRKTRREGRINISRNKIRKLLSKLARFSCIKLTFAIFLFLMPIGRRGMSLSTTMKVLPRRKVNSNTRNKML